MNAQRFLELFAAGCVIVVGYLILGVLGAIIAGFLVSAALKYDRK